MKRTVELLKEAGVAERLQKHFDRLKPPVGTSDECIIEAIEGCIGNELRHNEELADKFFDAMMMDASEAIKNEIHIEYGSVGEFTESTRNVLGEILEFLITGTRKE